MCGFRRLSFTPNKQSSSKVKHWSDAKYLSWGKFLALTLYLFFHCKTCSWEYQPHFILPSTLLLHVHTPANWPHLLILISRYLCPEILDTQPHFQKLFKQTCHISKMKWTSSFLLSLYFIETQFHRFGCSSIRSTSIYEKQMWIRSFLNTFSI